MVVRDMNRGGFEYGILPFSLVHIGDNGRANAIHYVIADVISDADVKVY